MTKGSCTSSAGRCGSDTSFWLGPATARAARRLPPAPIFPCSDMVWTARHACKPPRAATFLSTISAAESWARDEVVFAPAAREMQDAKEIETARNLRNMCASSLQDLQTKLKPIKGVELAEGNRYSTASPSARKFPITTLTRSPRFTRLPTLEKAIQ